MKRLKSYQIIPFVIAIALFAAACRPSGENAPGTGTSDSISRPEPTAPATATTASTTVAPAPTPAQSPETTATASPEADAAGDEIATVQLVFPIPPFDRSPYAVGLVEGSQVDLEAEPGAPVYHMAITIDESLTQVSGRQTVYFTNQEDVLLDEVYFHLHPTLLEGLITVSDVYVDGRPVEPELVEGGTAIRIPLDKDLQPGKHTIIDMSFETTVPTDIGRNYGVLAYYENTLALAHFYPMLAVYDDEGWNITPADVQGDITYSDTGYYMVEVTAPDTVTLVAAGTEIAREASAGRQTARFAAGPARDFFLVASPDYQVTSRTVGETTINSYGPEDLQAGSELALDVAAAALETYREWLGAYPYTELDIVTTPTSALGIEYPGIIVGTVNMYDVTTETGSGIPMAVILESTTAHEVGHQWFYNLVGNDQLDEPWLDEALVSYGTYRYFLDRYGEQSAEGFYDSLQARWDRVEGEEIPVGLPVADYEGPEYGAIVYGRGAVFMRALEETMGRATFDGFLRDYVAQNRWGIATAANFRALAEQHCDCDLGAVWAEWVDR